MLLQGVSPHDRPHAGAMRLSMELLTSTCDVVCLSLQRSVIKIIHISILLAGLGAGREAWDFEAAAGTGDRVFCSAARDACGQES